MSKCEHMEFRSKVAITRMEDTKQFSADVEIWCKDCRSKFRFLGLPLGLNLNGPAMSADGFEARLAIAPPSYKNDPLGSVEGFGLKVVQ